MVDNSVRAWQRAIKPHLPDGWALAGRLAYRQPVGWVLFGVLGVPSDAGGVYITRVRTPTYYPEPVAMVLNYSDRYGGGTATFQPQTDLGQRVIAEAVAQVEQWSTDYTRAVVDPHRLGDSDVRMREMNAYGVFLEGDEDRSLALLDGITGSFAPEVGWEFEMMERVAGTRALIGSCPSEAVARLKTWRDAWLAQQRIERAA